MLGRHLLFFLIGALLALAAVSIVRAGDDGAAAGSAGRVGSEPTSTSTPAATALPRSVRLRTHRGALRGHRREGASATSSKAVAPATPVRGTGGAARPASGGAGIEPSPGTAAAPSATVPDDTTETVPGDGNSQTTEPAAPTGASTGATGGGADPPPPEPSAGVTIPNPATPDASVNP